MPGLRYLLLGIGLLILPLQTPAQHVVPRKDSLPFMELPTITVLEKRTAWEHREAPVTREDMARTLQDLGLALIDRGSPLGFDVYLAGFKRGEVGLVIDGERYPNSCPNRMDPPLLRVNPLELAQVAVHPTTASPFAELGGAVLFHRRPPSRALHLEGALTQHLAGAPTTDLALTAGGGHHRLALRLLRARSYRDARGRSFGALYGYTREDVPYHFVEGALSGQHGLLGYRVEASTSRDVPFPYLLMDERSNTLVGASVHVGTHRLYGNYTHHRMNNGLRQAPMFMETDARNLTLGLTDGRTYEAYYRRWRATNTMIMGNMAMEQPMIPTIHTLALQGSHRLRRGALEVVGRLGLRHYRMGDRTPLEDLRRWYPEASSSRWFPVAALLVNYTRPWQGTLLALGLEAGSAPPPPEVLFLLLKRPGNMPWRVGNPTLAPPVRLSLHAGVTSTPLRLSASVSRVFRYAVLTARSEETLRAVTYMATEALLASLEALARYGPASLQLTYTYGQNLSYRRPLPEILPLQARLQLQTPEFHGLQAYTRLTLSARQDRVDATLGETEAEGYHRLDAGLSYRLPHLTLMLEGENLTNTLYYDPLAYLRDPFRSGNRVYAPERTLRFKVRWTY